jgi:hypothetical protein
MNKLKRKYFEIWADEEAQNFILKWILIFALLLIVAETAALTALALRRPTLVAVGEAETKVLTLSPPRPELLRAELDRTLKLYVEAHYNWDFTTIEKAHEMASKFVAEQFRKSFIASNLEQVKQAKERKVSQTVYVSKPPQVDVDKMLAKITLDRIFTVEGIKATAPLTLEVGFDYGARTENNPEGIYVTSEKMIPEPVK